MKRQNRQTITLPLNPRDEARFHSKIDRHGPDECWPWLAGAQSGHPRFKLRGATVFAHVLAYALATGEQPGPGQAVLHPKCKNKSCCNPAHLAIGLPCLGTEENLAERFFKHVIWDENHPKHCWEWKGTKSHQGYPKIKVNGRPTLASHVIFFLIWGWWPNRSLGMLHKCNNPGCVNPFHLREGTQRENCEDRDAAGHTTHGKKCHTAKRTPEEVVCIRRTARQHQGVAGINIGLARFYRMTHSAVASIVRCKSWKRVRDEDFPDVQPMPLEKLDIRELKGERCPKAKLTERQVQEMRYLHDKCRRERGTPKIIARLFSMGTPMTGRIVSRRAWTHVQNDFAGLEYLHDYFLKDERGDPIFNKISLEAGAVGRKLLREPLPALRHQAPSLRKAAERAMH
ncbi:MAG: HNH endonuclease [Limisphaerales bacterium]